MEQLYNLAGDDPKRIEAYLQMPFYTYMELLERWAQKQKKIQAENASNRRTNRH